MHSLFWNNKTISLHTSSPQLPVELNGTVQWIRWKSFLPLEQLKRGEWASAGLEPVTICASRGLCGGVWFLIREGIQGFIQRDKQGKPVVYILTAPSTHYFKTMTGVSRMPVLLRQVI